MSDSVDRVFIHALQTVRKLPRAGSSRPPPHDRLRLYGLYKQSMEGDVSSIMPRPVPPTDALYSKQQQPTSPTSPTSQSPPTPAAQKGEVEKWDAWNACAGMSRTEAKRKYIDYLIATMKEYACGTREGKELVGELEFVWDQIRSNTSNSHTGSGSSVDSRDGRSLLRPGMGKPVNTSNAMMHSFNTGQPLGPSPSSRPLRVLSPVSRSDGGDISGREDDPNAKDDNLDHDDQGNDDDDSDETDEYDEAPETPEDRHSRDPSPTSRQKPKKPHRSKRLTRIERALTKLTTELAALREQLSSSHSFPAASSSSFFFSSRRPRYSSSGSPPHGHVGGRRFTPSALLYYLWRLVRWILWTAIRQIVLQMILLGCVVLWGRWKGDRRLEEGVVKAIDGLRGKVKRIVGEGEGGLGLGLGRKVWNAIRLDL